MLVAEAANTVAGLDIRTKPGLRNPGVGQGWVTVGSMVPASFRTVAVTLVVVVCLGSDIDKAEDLIDLYGVPMLDAVTNALACAGVRLEPVSLSTEQGGTLHGYTLTLTVEV